jgi:type II secretory pathway pseudopilin PulG
MITIMIMGIVFAIATSTWFRVVESRRVDSATNQMASDLHLAHIRATNRLEDWKVDFQVNSGNYSIGSCTDLVNPDPCAAPLPETSERSLEESAEEGSAEERTEFPPGMAVVRVVFKPTGEAEITGAGNIQIAAVDGSPCHVIEVNEGTSRIKVVPGYNNECL